MAETPIKELFDKMLRGQCTEKEIARIITYLQHAETDEDIPGIEEVREMLADIRPMDLGTADRIFNDVVETPARIDPQAGSKLSRKNTLMMAASLTLFLALSVYVYVSFSGPNVTFQTAYEQLDSVVLDDGTRIMLNANTKIRVHKDFLARNQREIWLDGEAFFEVAHMPEKPFVVHTKQGMDITVLGTAFNVNARNDEARVVLSNGSVKAKYRQDEQLLEAGEMLHIAPGSRKMERTVTDTLYYASWRHQLLAFKNESLYDVANTIKDRYGYSLVFSDTKLETLQFTGAVPSDDLDLAINMIALVFDPDIKRQGKRITLITK